MFRYLKIAFSVAFALVCVLLIGLWVRSYWQYDWLGGLQLTPRNRTFYFTSGCLIESANGVLIVEYAGEFWKSPPCLASAGTSSTEPQMRVTGDDGESARNGFRAKTYPTGMMRMSAPHWFLILLTGAVSAAVWIPWRFSLRTLLIGMTAAAIGLGWAIYAIRN